MTAKDWVTLAELAALEPNDATAVELNGRWYAVYDTADGYFVSEARCTHAGANLCDGYFDGKHIECPLHQGLFDARTGAAVAAPVTRNLRMFDCRVIGNKLEILLQKPPANG